jgi:hypothetical protein
VVSKTQRVVSFRASGLFSWAEAVPLTAARPTMSAIEVTRGRITPPSDIDERSATRARSTARRNPGNTLIFHVYSQSADHMR